MTRVLDLCFILCGCLMLLAARPAHAIETVKLTDTTEFYLLSPHLEFLEDPTQELTIDDVLSEKYQNEFYRSDLEVYSIHNPGIDVWMRFKIENVDNINQFWFLELGANHAGDFDVYYSRNNKEFTKIRNDRDLPYHRRYDHLAHQLHNIKISRGDETTFYVRMNAYIPMIFNLKLHTVKEYISYSMLTNILLGIYYGMILMLFIYSLFNYYALKNATYLWFGIYMLSLATAIFAIDGNFLWLFPDISGGELARLLNILIVIFVFSALTYAQQFLHIQRLWPRYNKILRGTQYLLILFFLATVFGPIDTTSLVTNLMPTPILLLLIIAGVLSLKRGHQPARLYLLGFSIFAVGGIISNMAYLGVVPINEFTYHTLHAGSALEAVFLMFALSQQMSLLEKEREEAQDKALAVLEQKVVERTSEIREQKEEIEEKNKDITDSIRYAQRIQAAILPKGQAIASSFSDYFVMFKPRDIVSGDFYWFAEAGGRALIAACDCTGHGVPGAFVSMIGNDLLNQTVLEKGITNPGQILSSVNKGIKSAFTMGEEQDAEDGMDMSLCSVDFKNQKLEFSGANNPLLMMRNGALERTKGDITPIGGNTAMDFEFKTHEIDFKDGDVCYIFSDGYQDQFGGPKGKKFMIKKLKALLFEHHQKPFSEQKSILESNLTDWMGDQDQVDDILLIGIKL
ncbi:MAG: SpoIIE family protein phosphatase [Flavobacteriales bacterium]|nr:SpoIIE family protein phosphatase [Flavobacteriales bacterium]